MPRIASGVAFQQRISSQGGRSVYALCLHWPNRTHYFRAVPVLCWRGMSLVNKWNGLGRFSSGFTCNMAPGQVVKDFRSDILFNPFVLNSIRVEERREREREKGDETVEEWEGNLRRMWWRIHLHSPSDFNSLASKEKDSVLWIKGLKIFFYKLYLIFIILYKSKFNSQCLSIIRSNIWLVRYKSII